MEYITEDQILHYKELCAEPVTEITEDLRLTKLFRDNIRLANHIAYKTIPNPNDVAIDKDDIYQAAYLGLWEACISFDESKGFAFSTYAVPTIRGRILYTIRESEPLQTPRSYKDMKTILRKYNYTLPLTEEEIIHIMAESNLTRSQIESFIELSTISLDLPLSEDHEVTLSDTISGADDIEINLSDEEIEYIIDTILKYIKPKDRDIVEEWMYATIAGVHLTQNDLAAKYHRSQAQICRVISAAIHVVNMHSEEIRNLFGI